MRQKIWEKLRGDNIRGKIKAATTVEAYIAKQKSPQKEICQTLRQIILKTFPETEEEMKMGVPWYGGRCYIVALKDHVNLGVCIEGLTEKQLAKIAENIIHPQSIITIFPLCSIYFLDNISIISKPKITISICL